MKPVQTGAAEGAGDLAFLRAAAGVPAERCDAPYVFGPPLAPAVCARMAGVEIDPAAILASFAALRRRCDLVVVEGAGGLLVPLDGETTMAELAGALGLPVLVAALPSLGTLNHTALTVEAARARGLEILGVVLSRLPAAPGPAEATNPAEIERLTGVELVGAVPELPGMDVDRAVAPERFEAQEWLAPGLGGRFDRTAFLAGPAGPGHAGAPLQAAGAGR
jgi:dethiobiotin synthetase